MLSSSPSKDLKAYHSKEDSTDHMHLLLHVQVEGSPLHPLTSSRALRSELPVAAGLSAASCGF